MARSQTQIMSQRRGLDRLAVILTIAFVVVAAITAVVAFNLVKNFVQSWTMTSLEGVQIAQPTQVAVNAQGTPIPVTEPLQAPAGPAAVAWDGNSRVTILLIGLDYRDWESGDVPRSDTMMLLTLDPISKTAGMMSIPRDMWVNIPKVNTYGKINQAYYYGELYKLPGGGPGLAVETVKSFLGVPINYYAQIDFSAFEKFIDELKGIDIQVTEEIKVDPLGRNPDGSSNTIYLKPGMNHLTGPAALGYARNRYTAGGDFDRANRQQQVVMAIRDRVLQLNMLPNLISNAPNIYKDLSSGIHTNLSIDQTIKLALLAKDISKENIRKGVLGVNETDFAKSPDGLDILIPRPDKIRIVRDEIFTTGGPAGPAAINQDELNLMKTEGAKVSLRNATTTVGLANQTTDFLKKAGVNIIDTNNADKVYTETMIYIYTGKPYTAKYLATTFNVPTSRVITQYQPDNPSDIVVFIGQDWARKNPMTNK
jgi:polyisoprenyl-teichoic acid--peptidoglycan teichoic acid transferase